MVHHRYKSNAAKRLGRRLRQLREERGLKLEELGRLSDTDPGNLSRIEHGLSEPTLPRLRALAKVLGVEASDLLCT